MPDGLSTVAVISTSIAPSPATTQRPMWRKSKVLMRRKTNQLPLVSIVRKRRLGLIGHIASHDRTRPVTPNGILQCTRHYSGKDLQGNCSLSNISWNLKDGSIPDAMVMAKGRGLWKRELLMHKHVKGQASWMNERIRHKEDILRYCLGWLTNTINVGYAPWRYNTI